jgi:hypothetical protein
METTIVIWYDLSLEEAVITNAKIDKPRKFKI